MTAPQSPGTPGTQGIPAAQDQQTSQDAQVVPGVPGTQDVAGVPGTPDAAGTTGPSGTSGDRTDPLRTVAVGEVVELADTGHRQVVVAGRRIPLVYRPCAGDGRTSADAPDQGTGDPADGPTGTGRHVTDRDRARLHGLVEYLRVRPEKIRATVVRQADWPVALVRDRGLVCGALVVDLSEKEETGPTVPLRDLMDTPVTTDVDLRQRYRALAQLCVLLDTFRRIGRDLVGLTVDDVRVGDRGRTVLLTGTTDLAVGAVLVDRPTMRAGHTTPAGPAAEDAVDHSGYSVLNRASYFAGLVARTLVGRRELTATDFTELPPDVQTMLHASTGPAAGTVPDFLDWWAVLKTVATGVVRAPRPSTALVPVPAPVPEVVGTPVQRRVPVRQILQVLPGMVTVLGAALLVLGVLGLLAGAAVWNVVAAVVGAVFLVGGLVTGVRGMRRRAAGQAAVQARQDRQAGADRRLTPP